MNSRFRIGATAATIAALLSVFGSAHAAERMVERLVFHQADSSAGTIKPETEGRPYPMKSPCDMGKQPDDMRAETYSCKIMMNPRAPAQQCPPSVDISATPQINEKGELVVNVDVGFPDEHDGGFSHAQHDLNVHIKVFATCPKK